MRNSWKLGLFAALCVSSAIVGCGDDDDSTSSNGGTGGSSAGKGGSTNMGGSSAGKGGTTSGGNGGKGGTTSGGNGGKGGTTSGGKGGTAPVGGSSDGGSSEGGATEVGGAGGAPVDCMEEAVGGAPPEGGAGGAPSAVTAVVLFDNITVKNGNTVVKTWAFDNGNDIADVLKGDVGDKWLRPPFDTNPVNLAYSSAYSHTVFSKCDGKPAGGLAAIVPFTDAAQYFKMGIGFASADWSGYTITADIKLASGGNQEGACGMQAALFVQDGADKLTGDHVYLNVVDGWKTMSLTVPAATNVDHLSINISDYTCL